MKRFSLNIYPNTSHTPNYTPHTCQGLMGYGIGVRTSTVFYSRCGINKK